MAEEHYLGKAYVRSSWLGNFITFVEILSRKGLFPPTHTPNFPSKKKIMVCRASCLSHTSLAPPQVDFSHLSITTPQIVCVCARSYAKAVFCLSVGLFVHLSIIKSAIGYIKIVL